MKMKKWMTICITIVLVIALAACGGKGNNQGTDKPNNNSTNNSVNNSNNNSKNNNQPNPDEPVIEEGAELLVWDNGDAEGEWAKYVAAEFEKVYGIPVRYEKVEHTAAPGKLQIDGPAGLGADVFNGAHDHTGNMAAAGLILENFYADEYYNDAIDAGIIAGTYEDRLYGYPISIETYGLFYNKDLVDEAPDTWEELIKLSKEFNDPSKQQYGFMMEVGNFYYNFAFVGAYGGYVFGTNNSDPNDIGLNGEGALKAGQFMQRLRNEILPLKKEDVEADIKNSLFQEGKLMFDVNGPWQISGYRDAGVNFGIAPLPKLENGKRPTSFSGIKSYYVNAYTKYPEAASLYAKFATSKEMQSKRFEMTGQVPTRKDMLEDAGVKNDPIASAFLEQALHAIAMPNIPEMQNVWTPMIAAFSLIWNEDVDIQETLDSAVQQIKDANQLGAN